MMRQLSEPLLLFVASLLLCPFSETTTVTNRQCSAPRTTFRHLVVLVHGYMGSDREQEYLGETLLKENEKLLDGDESQSCPSSNHELVILNSKANVAGSTDGVAKGGKRLAAEITEWIEQQTAKIESSSTIVTFSLVGNSLGGLYGRYALADLAFFHDSNKPIIPLLFCTTSSPHIGISQETFLEFPRWLEPHVATAFRQQTMNDLFGVNNSTVVKDMCLNSKINNDKRDYLFPLGQFRKRIAVANAYKTDFLVSVSTGAFLSKNSDSIHHHQDSDKAFTRLMKDMGHVALQVVTKSGTTNATMEVESRDDDDESESAMLKKCVDSLDSLGWHKIFIDTRNILPAIMSRATPALEIQASYTSKELKAHFETYGTLFPVAHPLNMANCRTDLYRKITRSGQPIVDALAELLVSDIVDFSEEYQRS